MRMASTIAKIGRSMKKWGNFIELARGGFGGRRSRKRRGRRRRILRAGFELRKSRVDSRAGLQAREAIQDHLVRWHKPGANDAQTDDKRSRFDHAGDDRTVFSYNVNQPACLI